MAKLTKAPVFYAVAQVTHSPILKLESMVPDLQDCLRKDGFPGYRSHKQVAIEVHANPEKADETRVEHSEVLTHLFTSRTQSESIVISAGSIAFQTVEYDTFDDFLAKFSLGVAAVREILMPDSFTRIGFRFLDAVFPPEAGLLDEYVRPAFFGLQQVLDEPWLADYTFSETVATRDGRRTKARVLTRDSPVAFPPDLVASAPPLPQRFKSLGGVHSLIDTDASVGGDGQFAQEFETTVIMDHVRNLKADLESVFRAVVTDKAIKDWA